MKITNRVSLAENNQAILTQFVPQVWNSGNFDRLGELVAPQYTLRHDPDLRFDIQELRNVKRDLENNYVSRFTF